MVFNFEQLMELLCSCTGHAPGICWLADEAMALYNTIDDELIPMTRLKCLPCTDLYAPFELVRKISLRFTVPKSSSTLRSPL